MTNNVNEMFHGMFGGVTPGKCRLAMNGRIAVKTSNGYKTYDVNTGKLTNCSNFVFDAGDEFFFVIPTNKVEKGDLILVGDRAKCVIDKTKGQIKVLDYETSAIEQIVPERHVFMGNTYFYGKIVSMFGELDGKNKKSMGNVMKYMMLSKMMKRGSGSGENGGMDQTMMLLMLGGGNFGSVFDGMFNFGDDEEEDEVETESKEKDAALNPDVEDYIEKAVAKAMEKRDTPDPKVQEAIEAMIKREMELLNNPDKLQDLLGKKGEDK